MYTYSEKRHFNVFYKIPLWILNGSNMSCFYILFFSIFNFWKGKIIEQTAKTICAVYGDGVIPDSNVCKRLSRFRSGQFYEENQESSDRRAIVDG